MTKSTWGSGGCESDKRRNGTVGLTSKEGAYRVVVEVLYKCDEVRGLREGRERERRHSMERILLVRGAA